MTPEVSLQTIYHQPYITPKKAILSFALAAIVAAALFTGMHAHFHSITFHNVTFQSPAPSLHLSLSISGGAFLGIWGTFTLVQGIRIAKFRTVDVDAGHFMEQSNGDNRQTRARQKDKENKRIILFLDSKTGPIKAHVFKDNYLGKKISDKIWENHNYFSELEL